ncbi:hypothetical protein EP227_06235 [bacterium]|nr:MAG: hypothetical protein EP227_06235 [bacterium]
MLRKNYHITIGEDRLSFITSSFQAEKESVLPKGVYSKEFSAMLCASAVCILAYLIISFTVNLITAIHIIILTGIFITSFLFSRKLLFREKFLEVVFNRSDNLAYIRHPGMLKKKSRLYRWIK